MPTISREFTAAPGNWKRGGNNPRYIVVHHTDDDGSAWAVAHWKANDYNPEHPGSFQYVLDGGGTIYQMMEDTDTAYAVGAWKGCVQYIGNDESISIEVCASGTPFTVDEIAELRWLVRRLMEKHGIPAERVVRHYDCMSGRKDCPRAYTPYVEGGDAAWRTLHDTITRGELMTPQDVWNCDLAYQEVKTGKQVNRPAWNIVSWTGHNVEYMLPKVSDMQPKVSDIANRSVKLEKAVADLTALVKAQQKTLNAIVKKLA